MQRNPKNIPKLENICQENWKKICKDECKLSIKYANNFALNESINHSSKNLILQFHHLKAFLKSSRNPIEKRDEIWKKILWFEETKTGLFGHSNFSHVWRKRDKTHLPKNAVKIQ